jgi:hypothetical protein
MGNGEGHTCLILTDAESRLIREAFEPSAVQDEREEALDAFNRGIQRATDRIAAEFAAEQKARKALKPDAATTVQKGKP